MKREDLNYLLKRIDVDWVENNCIEAHELLIHLIKEHLYLMDRIDTSSDSLELAHKIIKELNKEIKTIKKLNKK